jgi:hypothetical protein
VIDLLRSRPWPSYVIDWHISHLRISTTAEKSIGSILENVTFAAARGLSQCACEAVKGRVGRGTTLPEINGHIFCLGREYKGPWARPLHCCNTNIPRPSRWNFERAWERAQLQFPCGLVSEGEWRLLLTDLWSPPSELTRRNTEWPSTFEVYKLRKVLEGLVIGHIDRNPGELCLVCPVLYAEALEKNFGDACGYCEIFPRKISARSLRGVSPESVVEKILQDTPPDVSAQLGGPSDVVRAWRRLYMHRGWNKFASYDSKGGFNEPYVLFKAKNIQDPVKRATAWQKARPIAPATKHPMRRLLHLAGRAWSFITANIGGEHFTFNKTDDIFSFFKQAQALQPPGTLRITSMDIEGCFPNMPKPDIELALRDIVQHMRRRGLSGVAVPPRSDLRKCAWTVSKGDVWMPFDVLCDIAEFALHNALISRGGRLLRQVKGIPMGDPLSPGMTIGTCAWMECEWMRTLSDDDKAHFTMARFMDDVLIATKADESWDTQAFLRDLEKSTCYHPPLRLIDTESTTFLEATYACDGTTIRHWLKNVNTAGQPRKVWRYHHFYSYAAEAQKQATLFATLQKVHKAASDGPVLVSSAWQKLVEFSNLQYPRPLLRRACARLAAGTGCKYWWHVFREL